MINGWVDQSYTVRTLTIALNGTYNMVLEFYENGGENRISFSVVQTCSGTENTNTYGANNIWNGYVYDGINFDIYAGMVHEGAAGSPDFDQNFGRTVMSYATSVCPVETETSSVRYRLTKTFDPGTYMFTQVKNNRPQWSGQLLLDCKYPADARFCHRHKCLSHHRNRRLVFYRKQ